MLNGCFVKVSKFLGGVRGHFWTLRQWTSVIAACHATIYSSSSFCFSTWGEGLFGPSPLTRLSNTKLTFFTSIAKAQTLLFSFLTPKPRKFKGFTRNHYSRHHLRFLFNFFCIRACFSFPNLNFTLWHQYIEYSCDLNWWVWNWIEHFWLYYLNNISHVLNRWFML